MDPTPIATPEAFNPDLVAELVRWIQRVGWIPGMALAGALTGVVRAWFPDSITQNDRILIVPLLFGLLIGVAIEASTPTFMWSYALQKGAATGCGAAYLYRLGKGVWR